MPAAVPVPPEVVTDDRVAVAAKLSPIVTAYVAVTGRTIVVVPVLLSKLTLWVQGVVGHVTPTVAAALLGIVMVTHKGVLTVVVHAIVSHLLSL